MSRLSRTKPNALIASATTVGPKDQATIARIQAARRAWQRQAAQLYYQLAEFHYPANYFGNALSRFAFPVGVIPEGDLTSTPAVPGKDDRTALYNAAESAMFSLEGSLGGMPELARLYGMNETMTGEGWLVGKDTNGETDWEYLSIIELVPTDQGNWIRNYTGSPSAAGSDFDYKPDYTKRFWRADPFTTQVADASTSALVSDAQQLVALNQSITSRIVTRLAQAGILFLDTSLQVPGAVQAPTGDGNAVQDPFYSQFLQTLEAAILRRGGPEGSIPIIVRGQGKPDDLISFITMDRTIDRVEMELRAELRANIRDGMDLPAEAQKGMGDATHFQAWTIGDATYQEHLLPGAQRWADSISRVFLWPALRAWAKDNAPSVTERDIRRHVVIADGSAVVTRPNQAEDMRQASDRLAVNLRALREGSGIPDTSAPSEEEYVQQLGVKTNQPYLATFGMDIHDKIDWDKLAKTTAGEGAPGAGGTPPSKRPADSSDPTGAPGIKDGKKNAADLFAAAASGHLLAAQKAVGATVRARCEPHPEVFAEIKSAPNEGVLARLEAEHLDAIGVTEADLAEMFEAKLGMLAEFLAETYPEPEVTVFVASLADHAASRPTLPITAAECRSLALRVLSDPDT